MAHLTPLETPEGFCRFRACNLSSVSNPKPQLNLQTLFQMIEQLSARVARLEQVNPGSRALSWGDVQQAVEQDPYARFEVLAEWARPGRRYVAGQVVRADQVPQLRDLMHAGLKLAVPQDNPEEVARMKDEADAKRELNRQALEQVQLLATEAEQRQILEALPEAEGVGPSGVE